MMNNDSEKILEVKGIKKYFDVKGKKLHAVDDVNLFIKKSETLGLVGESGCGKSTTGRLISKLLTLDSGEITFKGRDISGHKRKALLKFRRSVQMVFQDPYSSLDPRLSVGNAIAEPLILNKIYKTKKDMQKRIRQLMQIVGIEENLYNAYPHELDGGMRQRVGVARALAINPEFIVLDEPVSALDVCIQAQILNLLKDLQNEFDLTYLFISHDLSVVKFISDRIAVMYLGKIVELAESERIFKKPLHPYTQALLSAIPSVKKRNESERIILKGDVPSPVEPAPGCRFASRCLYAKALCKRELPQLVEYEDNTYVACHFVGKLTKKEGVL